MTQSDSNQGAEQHMPAPRVPDEAPHCRVRLRTRWSDEDNQEVLNNAVYHTLFEEARFTMFHATGLMEANHFPFVLGQCNVRFLRPGRGGVDVEVEVWTTHLGTSSMTQAYRVVPVGGSPAEEAWCEAEALLVGWSAARRGRAAWSPMFRTAVEALRKPARPTAANDGRG